MKSQGACSRLGGGSVTAFQLVHPIDAGTAVPRIFISSQRMTQSQEEDSAMRANPRRKFFAALGAAGVAAAAAAGARREESESAVHADARGRKDKGYQLTAHVRTYYRTTRI